ncbi:MAG TPA: hypothetical protein VMR75_02880 [Candidatus Saccharimonadales bacterium]|nr:hypothetical protein [Candidatus Saccharimonadales bacterium]
MQAGTGEKPGLNGKQDDNATASLSASQKEQLYQVLCLQAAIVAVTLLVMIAVLASTGGIDLTAGLAIGGVSCLCSGASLVCLIGWKYRTYPEKGLSDQPVPNHISGPIVWSGWIGGALLLYALLATLTGT